MAKQTGILPIQGTIGNLTFFKSQDGFMVKSKSEVSASRIATDSAFQRTRENNAEFGRAGKGGKILRTALRNDIAKARDSRMISRLTTTMLKVVQADAVNDRGMRNVIDGEAALLSGFDFNITAKLSATLFAPFTASFTRDTGAGSVSFASLNPQTGLAAPAGTTHVRLFAALASVDFEGETFEVSSAEGEALAYNATTLTDVSLDLTLAAGSTHPVFLTLGVEFLQQVNNKLYSLNNGSFNACSITRVYTV